MVRLCQKGAKRSSRAPNDSPRATDTGQVIGRKEPVYFILPNDGVRVRVLPAVRASCVGDEVLYEPDVPNEMADGLSRVFTLGELRYGERTHLVGKSKSWQLISIAY